MFEEVRSTVRSARRIGETSLAMNKLALRWVRKRDQESLPVMLRDTMQSLGSTYIKLGQLVASSPTIFPDDYVDAFQTCLDQTEKLPYEKIHPILERELGNKLNTHFAHIDETPLASASIAQVHAAKLKTGEDVVIKVQKPGVKQILETDFNFLTFAAQMVELINPKAWKSSVRDIVEEIREGMIEECDFRQEANNIEEFRSFLKLAGIDQVVVPEVHEELSTGQVLVMERFFGVPISDIDGVKAIAPNPELVLGSALDTWFLSLRQCQIYHADLHAGNVMMLNDGRVGFIDFGIVGRLSEPVWEGLTSLAVCVPAGDFAGLAVALSKMGATKQKPDLDVFAKDLELLWKRVTSDNTVAVDDPDGFWKAIVMDLSSISKRHGIRFPREFTLLVKQFLYFDRYIRLLAPEVDMFDDHRMDIIGLNG